MSFDTTGLRATRDTSTAISVRRQISLAERNAGATEYIAFPMLVMNIESARDGRNVIHDVHGAEFPAVSFRPASSRKGTLEMLFADEWESEEAERLHLHPGIFSVRSPHDSTGVATMDMDYVVDGAITRTLDPETRRRWLLRVGYREARRVKYRAAKP